MADPPARNSSEDATAALDPRQPSDPGDSTTTAAENTGRITEDVEAPHAQNRDPLDELALPPRFELRRVLGRGGMGVVVEVLDRNLGREVAVKLLALSRRDNPTYRVRFLREAKAAAMLRHPNIVTVHDVDPDRDFIVMELVKGESLRNLLKRERQLPVPEVRRIGLALLDALAAAHDARIVHRDIKPANILIDTTGTVKLVDFGIASFGDRDLTSSGVQIGTPAYMAPEQLRGRVADTRADLYAVGATLFEAATGIQLHSQTESTRDVGGEILRATGDEALAAALVRATAELPQDRFPDARAFAAALAAPTPLASPPPPALPRRRRRAAIAIAIGTAHSLAAVATVVGLARDAPERASSAAVRTIAVLPFADHTKEPRLDFAASGLSHILGTSLEKLPGLVVVGYYDLLDRIEDPAAPASDWLIAARAAGATAFVRGELFAEPAGVRLVIEITSPSGAKLDRIERMTSVENVPATTRVMAGDVARAILGRATPSVPDEVRKLEVERDLQLAITAIERNDLATADTHLQSAELRAPDLAEIHYYRAIRDWWLSRDARPAVTRALAGNLDDAQRGFMEGLRLLYDIQPVASIAKFRELAARFPDHRDIHYGLFEALYHGGRAGEAIEVYRRLSERSPRFRLGLDHVLAYYLAHADDHGLGWALSRLEPGTLEATRWQARSLAARREYDAAIALLRRADDRSGELDRQLVEIYLLAGQHELALDLAAGWPAAGLTHELLGLARARGKLDDVKTWSAKATNATDLTSGDPRERAWVTLAMIELPDAPLVRLRRLLDEIRASTRSISIPAKVMLAGATGDRELVEAARGHASPEVVAIADAYLQEWAGDWRAAVRAWDTAREQAPDGRFAILEAFGAARTARTLGDHGLVLAACDAVIWPRVFTWAWGGTVGPCLRWSAEAATALDRPADARDRWERLLALRAQASPADELVEVARAALGRAR